jgi:hypothetical protein
MPVRRGAIILGIVLVPVNCFWLAQMEMVTQYGAGQGGGPFPTTFSLFANVIVILLALRLLNTLLARVAPRWALNPAEMLVIYTMLCIASALDAIDFMDILVPMIAHVHRYDDPAAGRPYAQDILQWIPSYFTLSNKDALVAWHEGKPEMLWRMSTLRAWAAPLLTWGGVIAVLLWVMLCLTAMLRRRWIDQERLSYPITFIPVQIAQGSRGIFGAGAFWVGFGLAAGISLLNGLAIIWPWLPTLRVKLWDLSPWFVGRPWNAVGWTPISFYPFGIGLGYLLPPDLLFSTWFFHWLLKAERVLASATGLLGYDAQAPYVEQQCFGAYLFVAAFGLWLGRRYFAEVLRTAFGGRDGVRETFGPSWSALGAIGGMVALTLFFVQAGMSVWLAVLAWGVYWLIALAVTRMRAELGPPAHDLHMGGPDHMLPILLGTRGLGPRNLNLLTWFFWFNRAYRSLAMPHMLEGFCMARRQRFSESAMVKAIIIGGALGAISTFAALIIFGYQHGAEAKMAGHVTGFGWEAFGRLRGWLGNPTEPRYPALGAALGGMLFAAGLHRLTVQYLWWPLHPLGFAIAGSYSMSTLWCPMLIAWTAKTCLLHYGGQRAYMRAVPFFVGLLIGDYTLGCIWPLIGWFTGRIMYSFQQ